MFLDAWPALYFGVCPGFFGLMVWRPAWSSYIGAAEPLLTPSLLINSMAMRVTIVADDMIEEGRGFVTVNELLDYVISSAVAYLALTRGVLARDREFP